jgi:hypothetical protein
VAPNGDHWPFHERGVPAFFVYTTGEHPNYHTPDDDAVRVDPACLEAAARVVGTLVVRLGLHAEPLYDPHALERHLVHDATRFSTAAWREGRVVPAEGAADAPALVLDVPAGAQAPATWQALEAAEAREDSRWRLVRRAADLGRARREGRVALLVRVTAGGTPLDPAAVTTLAAAGYRWLAPWAGRPPAVAAEAAVALAEAAGAHGVLLDLEGLPAALHGPVLDALGGRPAAPRRHPLGAAGALGAVLDGPAADVVVGGTEADLVAGLAAWAAARPEAWRAPGSAERRAIARALGGALVEALAAADR